MEKYKLMWLCNVPTRIACELYDLHFFPFGGWLNNYFEKIISDKQFDFIFIFQNDGTSEVKEITNDSGTFIMVSNKCSKKDFKILLNKHHPDLIHIWGTEYIKTYNLVMASIECELIDKVIISAQGLISAYYYHYMGSIPAYVQMIPSIRDLVKNDCLLKQQRMFKKRGYYEIQSIKKVKHVIGRTFWDYSVMKLINPNVNYHYNGETLRRGFYENVWDKEKCIRHRLFVSQATYPIKGIHHVIESISLLSNKYSDITIAVAGANILDKKRYRLTSYEKYIYRLINKYNLKEKVFFLGVLNEEQMIKEYLKSEIFVSPSSIENSSNSIGEAMMLGMPIISSNVGGNSDLIIHNNEGFLYQYEAPYLLASYIDSFFMDESKEVKFSYNAREHAKKLYNVDKNYKDLLNIYKDVLSDD